MRLVLLYHGEAEGAAGRCIGRTDLPLSVHARRRAGQLADAWPYPPASLLVASSLQRSRAMIEPFARRFGRLPRVEPRLDEMDFGSWEGELWSRLHDSRPADVHAWLADWVGHAPAGGECFAKVAERAGHWLAQTEAEQGDDGLVLVAGHAGPIRALLCLALGLPLQHALRLALGHGRASALRQRHGRYELSYCNASRFEASLSGEDS